MKLLITTQVVDKNHPILGFFHGWILEFATLFDEVHVICLQKGQFSLPAHVHVYSLGKEAGENRLKYLWRFYTYFSKIFFHTRVDYVFFHMGAIYNLLAAPFFLLRRLYGTKFYWWKAHGHLGLKDKLASHLVDRIYTSTESGFPIDTKKRHVIGQAVDSSLFTYDANQVRHKLVLYVGRLTKIKHLEVLVAVAKELRADGYRFVVIGPAEDSAYTTTLLQDFAAAGIEYRGSQTQRELVRAYQSASIFLNPSLTHSMDKTVLEAALCGVLPLTANIAFADLLSPHGLLLEQQTPEAYVTKIKDLETKDTKQLREQLRAVVAREHSIDTFGKRIFNHG